MFLLKAAGEFGTKQHLLTVGSFSCSQLNHSAMHAVKHE
jgi:hypothetical protein